MVSLSNHERLLSETLILRQAQDERCTKGVATIHLPSGWTQYTDGVDQIPIDAIRVDEMLVALGARFPALAPLLEQVAIAIDGQIYHHARYEPLSAQSDVHLLPPVSGGACERNDD